MKKILVAVDFSKNTGKVVEQATILAQGLKAKTWVIHVTSDQLQAAVYDAGASFYDPSGALISAPVGDVEMARDLCAEEYKQEHRTLLRLSQNLREAGVDAQAMLLKGDAAGLILERAENLDIDVIVMGSHGHGILRKMLLGSVTETVLHKAFCNVLIVPPPME